MTVPAEVFSGRAPRLSMGLRPLDEATWLDPDPLHPQTDRRRDLLDSRRSQVHQALPDAARPAGLVAHEVARWVGQPLPGLDDPLVEAALLVRDDICVLAPDGDVWRLVAAVVCFPSRWCLADKMGADVLTIHDPVPRYRERLGAATGKALRADRSRWRVNWTLVDDPELFQPRTATMSAGMPDETWYLRVERQCLVPLLDVFAFTIRTDVLPLAGLAPENRAAVLKSAAAAGQELAAYRGWRSR